METIQCSPKELPYIHPILKDYVVETLYDHYNMYGIRLNTHKGEKFITDRDYIVARKFKGVVYINTFNRETNEQVHKELRLCKVK